jgi:hypothetical protein
VVTANFSTGDSVGRFFRHERFLEKMVFRYRFAIARSSDIGSPMKAREHRIPVDTGQRQTA